MLTEATWESQHFPAGVWYVIVLSLTEGKWEVTKHSGFFFFFFLCWVDLAYFHFSADVERRIETKPTPGNLLPPPFFMGRNSKRSIFKRTRASLTAFLFMKPGVHQGGLSVVITGGELGGKLAVISNIDFCCRHGTCVVICSLTKSSLPSLCGAHYC